MTVDLEVQVALDCPDLPTEADLRHWAEAALLGAHYSSAAEIVIRIVNEAESASLNQTYRRKPGPTNVLAFPFEAPADININLLGDVVICAPVVINEAVAQGKAPLAHWAHIVIHGILHLLGYDHQHSDQAEQMEALEARIMASLSYPNPYAEVNNH